VASVGRSPRLIAPIASPNQPVGWSR